ncbi:hypothetical protein LJC00_04370 [Dysgonomonas sp. OttesenSCG-928-M03]|nr:hypothetical protein [Dysgonomonas sp. OttesenSCG-928-M03]
MKTKTDLYTKVILTVIAIFLGLNFIKGTDLDIITTAKADNMANITAPIAKPEPKPQIVDVNVVQVNGVEFSRTRSPQNCIPVWIENK